MGEILGYATQVTGGPFQGLLGQHAQSARALGSFTATKRDGTVIGTGFRSMAEAQNAVQAAVGGPRLRWTRTNPNDVRIERFAGSSPFFSPSDLRERLEGGAWWRGDQGVREAARAGGVVVPQWSSFGTPGAIVTATTPAVTFEPTLSADGVDGRPALEFNLAGTDSLDTTLIGTLAAPMSAYTVSVWEPAGRVQVLLTNGGAGFEIRVTAGGDWEVDVGGSTISAGAAVAGRPEVISVRSNDVGPSSTVYRGRTAVATVVDAVAAGDYVISDLPDAWHRFAAEVLLIADFTNPALHSEILEYIYRRYPNAAA